MKTCAPTCQFPSGCSLKLLALLLFLLLPATASAQTLYQTAEAYSTVAVIDEGNVVDGWEKGSPPPPESFFRGEVTVEPGSISFDGRQFVQRDLTLPEINLLFPHFYVEGKGYDPALFPLVSSVAGPEAMQLLGAKPGFADDKWYIEHDPQFVDLRAVLPVGDALIEISFSTIWAVDDIMGDAAVGVSVFRPVGAGADFSVAERLPNGTDDGLEFTEEEAQGAVGNGGGNADPEDEPLEFDESEVQRFIDEEQEDLLKILGCAAGWRECPYGLDPDAVRTWMEIDENPAELLTEIMNERRASGGR